jgi:hypothetical protein
MTDKRSQSQWDGIMPEGMDTSWTAESQNEQAEHHRRTMREPRPMSREEEDIENSKRSRGERL